MQRTTVQANKEIAEVLKDFGLGDREREVYLAMLRLGPTGLAPVAAAAGMKLTTAQSAAARLAERGLVDVTRRGSRRRYEAADPSALPASLLRRAEEAETVVPLLRALKGGGDAAARIRVYERARMSDLFHEALAARNKVVHEIVAGRDIQDVLGEKFHFTRRRVRRGVRLKSLRVESREIKKYSREAHARELRDARFLPREMTFRCSMLCWDDTVAFITPKTEGLAWTVKSASFRDAFLQLFEVLWQIGRRMETA